jgi:hypothetical protein
VRRAATLASVLVLAAGCGDRRTPAPAAPSVARTLHEWVAGFRAEDANVVCSRTFMAYDVGRRLWPRIGLEASRGTVGAARTAPPERVRRDCLDTYGDGLRTLAGKPRIVRIGPVTIEGPVRRGGGITRTARADLSVTYRTPAGLQTRPWRARLVLYRGRWRVLQGYH